MSYKKYCATKKFISRHFFEIFVNYCGKSTHIEPIKQRHTDLQSRDEKNAGAWEIGFLLIFSNFT